MSSLYRVLEDFDDNLAIGDVLTINSIAGGDLVTFINQNNKESSKWWDIPIRIKEGSIEEIVKEFTLDDLEIGMRVEASDSIYVVMPGGFCREWCSWLNPKKYNQDLTFKGDDCWDIKKVFAAPKPNQMINPGCYGELLWERKPPEEKVVEITMEQLEALYQSKVKIIK